MAQQEQLVAEMALHTHMGMLVVEGRLEAEEAMDTALLLGDMLVMVGLMGADGVHQVIPMVMVMSGLYMELQHRVLYELYGLVLLVNFHQQTQVIYKE